MTVPQQSNIDIPIHNGPELRTYSFRWKRMEDMAARVDTDHGPVDIDATATKISGTNLTIHVIAQGTKGHKPDFQTDVFYARCD